MGDSGDFIFRRTEGGDLTWHGDFEGLYQAMPDPWGQSGEHPRMKKYYEFSRRRLTSAMCGLDDDSSGVGWAKALEVGCGTGHVANFLGHWFHGRTVHGCDISDTAIRRARELHPDSFFFHHDITSGKVVGYTHYYHVVILNQILWYVLHDLPTAIDNCAWLLAPGGHLIIQTAFLDNQEYGKGVVDGFHGLLEWFVGHTDVNGGWQIVGASYDASDRYAPHHDGILVLQRKD